MLSNEGYVTASDGVRLFYRKFGSGRNAVIIPNAVHMVDSFKHLTANCTLIFFDLRNRGASDPVSDSLKLKRGVHHDVDDLEAVRQHFGIDRVKVIGHSYVGLTVILYASKYPAHVRRVVQIGPVQPRAATQYPAHLTGADATFADSSMMRATCSTTWDGDHFPGARGTVQTAAAPSAAASRPATAA